MNRSVTIMGFVLAPVVMFSSLGAAAESVNLPQQSSKVIDDIVGDANGINGQGWLINRVGDLEGEEGIDTRPASTDGADLQEVRLQTLYSTVKDKDQFGQVVRVRYVPYALRFNFEMFGAVDSPGPTLAYRWDGSMGGCEAKLSVFVWGVASLPDDPSGYDAVAKCPGQVTSWWSSSYLGPNGSVAVAGNSLRMTLDLNGPLSDGATIGSGPPENQATRPAARVSAVTSAPMLSPQGCLAGLGECPPEILVIDTAWGGSPFVVGSDVPPTVDCLQQSSHPDCNG